MTIFHAIASFFKDKEYRELFLTTLFIVGLGTVVYHFIEGWTWIDALYFSVVTLTTVGYGDLYPITDAGKLFTVGYIILGIGIFLSFVDTVYHHYREEALKKGSS